MTNILMLFGMILSVFVTILFMRNIDNKKTKYVILIVPFIIAIILYSSVLLLTKNMQPGVCDGAALMGMFISFVFFGMGLLFNLINIFHLVLFRR